MNQLLICLLTVVMLAVNAAGLMPETPASISAEPGPAAYSVTSVTDCAKTSAQYDRFYESGELGIVIPGLREGLVPQGITYLPEEDQYLMVYHRHKPDLPNGNARFLCIDRMDLDENGDILPVTMTENWTYDSEAEK